MSEPTVQLWEGGPEYKVADLPGWHEHPECRTGPSGKPLAHMHGLSRPPSHTHLPVQAWGQAVPLTGGSPPETIKAADRNDHSLPGGDA